MNRKPSATADDAAPAPLGPTSSAPSDAGTPLPHERDQSIGQVGTAPQPLIEQAHRDLQAGQVDTDLRATAGQDAQRRERLLGTPTSRGSRGGDAGDRPHPLAPPADGRRAPRA